MKEYDGIFPEHAPYGTGVGLAPGRVVWVHDKDSVDWDGSGHWWQTENFDEKIIAEMFEKSITALSDTDSAKSAWEALIRAHNTSLGENAAYQPGEKIAIKANINGSGVNGEDHSGETDMSYTNAVLLKVVLTSLVDFGITPEDITVYDTTRIFPDYMIAMCTSGVLRGVNFVGRNEAVADQNAPINWSHDFSDEKNYLPTCVTNAKYLINLANLKGHSYGVTLAAKNHFGSFINSNTIRAPQTAGLHAFLTTQEMGVYSPLVDLMANAQLGQKTVLLLLDGLICAPSEGISITKKNATWKQSPFNGDFTESILVSQDPVAIDSVAADLLTNEPTVTEYNSAVADTSNENYLHEAGLVANPPSKTTYTDGEKPVTNLGVHEHWNNSTEKLYSRNLGEDEGIELVTIESD